MEVVLAGDIINSRTDGAQKYLNIFEKHLKKLSTNGLYQIYRGDSFQVYIENPETALHSVMLLKLLLKKEHNLDVRIAIGIGDVKIVKNDIAKSQGTALLRSGLLLDNLKDLHQNLMIDSGHHLDQYMNTAFELAMTYMENWTINAAQVMYEALSNPQLSQEEIGSKIGIKQATASRRLSRAHWNETKKLLQLYRTYLKDIAYGDVD